jgi:hypothetical protein
VATLHAFLAAAADEGAARLAVKPS